MAYLMCLLVAISLSMDTFSLSIIYGTLGMSKKEIITLSSIVGLFHFFMPLLGNMLGEAILSYIPIASSTIVGIIFFALAIEMLCSLIKQEEVKKLTSFWSLLLFGFTVSIDSFSVGIGLDAILNNDVIATTIFMITSFLFTFVGLLMGKKLKSYFGKLATIVGALLLFLLSIYYVLFL